MERRARLELSADDFGLTRIVFGTGRNSSSKGGKTPRKPTAIAQGSFARGSRDSAADGYGWALIMKGDGIRRWLAVASCALDFGALGLGWGCAFSGLGADGFGCTRITWFAGFYDAVKFYFGVLEVDQ